MTDDLKSYLISNWGKYSYKEIIDKYGVSVEDIQSVLRGNKSKRCKYADRTYENKLEIAEYRRYHSAGMTGRYFCVPTYVVAKIADEFGIEPISRSQELAAARIERFGSVEAAKQHMIEATKETSIKRYGVDNFAKSSEFVEKAISTCQNKYGVNNVMQSSSVKDTLMKSNIERFGVPWPQMNKDIVAKRVATNNERYGGSGWASPELRQKSIDTQVERYGTSHWKYNDSLTHKVNETCRAKHGVDWPCMYPEVKIMSNDSKPNREFAELLSKNNILYEREFGIGRKAFDFKVGNILIEINPSSTHNSTWGLYGCPPTEKNYHQLKTHLAEDNGYRCIHIWDWDCLEKVVELLKSRQTIYARNCDIRILSVKEESIFLNKVHLQGYTKSSFSCGLFYNNELVSVMTFGTPRYNKKFEWELLRYASSYNVVGGAEKLFSYFCSSVSPNSIISYCDRSKFTGAVYTKLGFNLVSTNIGKHWYNMSTKKHFTDNLVRQRGVDQLLGTHYGKGTSNEDLLREHRFVEIYDAGQSTFTIKF